jgi:hypothetical protein
MERTARMNAAIRPSRALSAALVGLLAAPLLALGCKDRGVVGDDTGPRPEWVILGEALPGALLGVTGRGRDDVWTVGGDDGEGPLVLHLHGETWTRVLPESPGDLWWVWLGETKVWTVGAAGRVLQLDPVEHIKVMEESLGASITLFGVWGASEDEVWVVGGDTNVSANGAIVARYRPVQGWDFPPIPAEAAAQVAVYKVWGRSADEVYAVGTGGVILRWDGVAWTSMDSPTDRTLFTVNGTADTLYAVGSSGTGLLLRNDGAAWTDVTPEFAPQQNGVSARAGCPAASVGLQTVLLREQGGVWAEDPRGVARIGSDFHAVWVDEGCGAWGAGGTIMSFPLTDGVLAYAGDDPPPAIPPL